MKIAYYPDTDSMYIDLSSKSSTESTEVSPGIVLDYDDKGNLVGIDIDNASKKMDLKELVLSKIPVNKQTDNCSLISVYIVNLANLLWFLKRLIHRRPLKQKIKWRIN